MMKKVFLFRNVRVDSAKVSHAMAVGLPSLTGLTGLAGAFAGSLAKSAGLCPTEITNAGILFAFEDYHLHEGYKKVTEKAQSGRALATRALASAYASFTAHFVIEVEAQTPAAADVLANDPGLALNAADILRCARLCGGSLIEAETPWALRPARVDACGSERLAALSLLPPDARVMVDATGVVAKMREEGLPLMEGLLAATMRHSARPEPFKGFFESVPADWGDTHQHTYGVVHDGYLLIGDTGRRANRLSYRHERLPVQVASPTLSLVRLQLAASLRSQPALEAGGHPADGAFWSVHALPGGYLCRPAY